MKSVPLIPVLDLGKQIAMIGTALTNTEELLEKHWREKGHGKREQFFAIWKAFYPKLLLELVEHSQRLGCACPEVGPNPFYASVKEIYKSEIADYSLSDLVEASISDHKAPTN